MAINKKLIHFKSKENFDTEVANGNILDNSIVFIQDSKEISTHGTVYKTVNWSVLEREVTPDNPSSGGPVIDATGKENGVYAITADGELVDYNSADATAIGVALIVGEHKFMIAKSEATDGTNTTFYWDKSYSDLSPTNYSNVDGTNDYGYLDGTSTPQLNKDFTTWTAGALSDFNGKANTAVVIAEASIDARDMCTVLNTFNASDSYNDWYIPACGQLALIYLNKTEINAALAKIGGTALSTEYGYWSSSEYSSDYAWYVDFLNSSVCEDTKGYYGNQVRFVRDIE